MQSKEYFKFIVTKVENDFNIYEGSKELSKALYLLKILKNSSDLLKDIYLISRIKNLKNFGNHLLFIYKKTESGEIKFDNLIDNLSTDKETIENELINYFNIDKPETDNFSQEDIKINTGRELKERNVSPKEKILIEKKFKVEELEEELVTEEFNEMDTKDNLEAVSGRSYLELVPKESEEEEKTAFVLPEKEETEEIVKEEDVFKLPAGADEKEIMETESTKGVAAGNGQIKELTETEEKDFTPTPEEYESEISVEEIIETEEDKEKDKLLESKEKEQAEEKENEEDEIPSVRTTTEKQETKNEEVKIEIEETITAEDISRERAIENEQNVSNTVYMKYETELNEKNTKIKSDLDELLVILHEDKQEEKDQIIKRIIENSSYMEAYSREMSFEIITTIYNTLKISFASVNDEERLTLDEDLIVLFRGAIRLIEGLIRGDEIQDLNKTIKSIEDIRNGLIERSKEKENLERINREKLQIERHLTEKFSDVSQRQKLLIMKDKILSVENIFKSLDTIKGKYQAYDALRTLSHTFNHLKEIAKIANNLDMRKLSQLTEAGYIFIKFIQNYRMDPLEENIKEIFKYIIYNFKLIYLDKPTKDIDVFISYLNDPIKIFESKKE